MIAAIVVIVVGVLLGIRTSIHAASSGKPFDMEGIKSFDKKPKAGSSGDGEETNPRDTMEEDAPNGDWLTDPMCA